MRLISCGFLREAAWGGGGVGGLQPDLTAGSGLHVQRGGRRP